jgi:acetyltransferase-like isoleucine patch superfamily enzyme
MVVRALGALPDSPVLAAKRLIGYLISPLLWRYVSVWRRFKRKSNIDESCWLGPNAWCSVYERQAGRARIEIRANVTLRGLLRLEVGGRIVIAEGCYVGDDCILDSAEEIVIARDTWLAHGVSVFDNDNHPLDVEARMQQALAYRNGRAASAPRPAAAPVRIGEHVWIGFNSFIGKGVSIGDRSIVAAYSVVTKDVPADCLVAGNPARVVRSLLASTELSA